MSAAHLRFGRPLALAFGRVLFWLLGPVIPRHADRIPREGGVLLLCNHLSDCDPAVVQLACPRPIYFMAKRDLWSMGPLGKVLDAFYAFPVNRGEPDRAALKRAITLLREGNVVCVYPEGQLSETGELQPILPGVSLIARQAGVPVVCGRIEGSNRVIPYKSLVPRPAFRTLPVTWSEPRTFGKADDPEEMLEWVSGELGDGLR